MSAADDAYREAERLIAEVKRTGAEELSFDRDETRALEVLPPGIGDLYRLTDLDLANTSITKLDALSRLTTLRVLRLSKTAVWDVAPLAAMTSLARLWLDGTAVTNLAPLSSLSALRDLQLVGTGVTDLAPIAGLIALTDLSLANTNVTDLAPLARLNGLKTLMLDFTNVTDLAPVSGLTGLRTLWLDFTRVADLSPLSGLIALRGLDLVGSSVFDLRPLRALRDTLLPSENALRFENGIRFFDTPATRADPRLAEIAEIEDDRERTRQFFDYLETWEPPDVQTGEGPTPDALLPVALEDGRLEIAASLPTEAERDERLKRALHDRLLAKVPELAQVAGNRFPRLAARARALVREVEKPFEELDMLLIHMEVDDLSASLARGAEREGEEAFTPDVIDALSDVVRIGPGLTLDHPDVELLEERKRRYTERPLGQDQKAAHDELSEAAAGNAGAIGDNLRRLEGEVAGRSDSNTAGAVQVAIHRNMLIRIGRWALSDGKQVLLGAAGSALFQFLHTNWPAVQTVAASYGPAFFEWFLAALSQFREVAGLAANVEWRPVDRNGGKRGD